MAFGSEVVEIRGCVLAIVRVKLALAVCAGDPESVTLKVSGAATASVGVPLICPVAAFKLKPLGRVPDVNCQVYVPVPPVAMRVCEYGELTVPPFSDVVVMVRMGGAMVNVRLEVCAVCAGDPESVTLKVSGVALTATLGVPLISPLAALSDSPEGNVPAVNCQV